MIDVESFSIGELSAKIRAHFPNMKFRDADKLIHYASDAGKCSRQVCYKKLGIKESNPPDDLGQMRMSFGNWIERGVGYELFSKMNPFGVIDLGSQGTAGEHGTFYGTSWHGYRDRDIAILNNKTGKFKPVVVELKTKVGYGASMMVKKSAWSKDFVVPKLDRSWGYPQQLSLYLRDAYLKTKDNPKFSQPIVDGILLFFLYDAGIAGFVEFYAEYRPETDDVLFYKVFSHDFPDCCGDLEEIVDLKEIASRWKVQDDYIIKGELAPPSYERRYSVDDPRIQESTKKDLTNASKNEYLIGDMQCKYCSFRDKCADDLKIDTKYSPSEIKTLKDLVKNL